MAQPSDVENISWLRKFYVKLQSNRWANKKINTVTIFSFTSPVCSKIEMYSILSKFHIRALFPRLNVSE